MENILNKNDYLLRVARHLILNASFVEDLGLFHGKMGIAIYFALYSRYIDKSLYNDFAGLLLEEIFNKVHIVNNNISFESGLCGIGWGIEYLLENKFVRGNSDEILVEIDCKIMEYNIKKLKNMSVEQGVLGIGYYVEKRLQSSCRSKNYMPFDKEFLSTWEEVKESLYIPADFDILLGIYTHSNCGSSIAQSALGISNGCAGNALKLIMEN